MDFEQFKNHCLILKRFVRELLEADVLTRQDLEDMRVGFLVQLIVSLFQVASMPNKNCIFSMESRVSTLVSGRRLEIAGQAVVLYQVFSRPARKTQRGGMILMPDKNTWKSYAKNAAEEKNIRASYHGISTTSQSK